jgi:hypothetical protein
LIEIGSVAGIVNIFKKNVLTDLSQLSCAATIVAKGPKFRPQNTKGAEKK